MTKRYQTKIAEIYRKKSLSKKEVSLIDELLELISLKELLLSLEDYVEFSNNAKEKWFYRPLSLKEFLIRRIGIELLNIWNNENIIAHRKLDKATETQIEKTLEQIDVKSLIKTILNYSKILNNEEYWFSYKWSLKDFLQRGNSATGQNNSKGWRQFTDEAKPFEVFGERDEIKRLISKFKPITTNYVEIWDKTTNKYYGFDADTIDNCDERAFRWLEERWNEIAENYGYFRELELLIAKLIKNRKSNLQKDKLRKYIEYWEKVKDNFKK